MVLSEPPHTESEMINLVITERDLPQKLKLAPIILIDTPTKKNVDSTISRPNTGDTIEQWLLLKPKPGSILAISNQPYIQYPDLVLKTIIPDGFTAETIGSRTLERRISVQLDTLARILFQSQQLLLKTCNEQSTDFLNS